MLDTNLGRALRLLSDAWEQLGQTAFVQQQVHGAIRDLPDLSFAGADKRAGGARALLHRMQELDEGALPHGVQVSLRQARYRISACAREADLYWTVMDPMGLGFFGMFAPSAYCGGLLLTSILQGVQAMTFTGEGDLDRYLALLADFSRLLDQMTERTRGQADRGMRMPRPQLPAARGLIAAFLDRSRHALAVAPDRLPEGLATPAFAAEVQRRIQERIVPAYERFAAVLSPEYEAAAPTGVGISQYEAGPRAYAELVKMHTTTTLTPEEIHDLGLRRMAQVQAEMRQIRAEAGLADDPAAYLARAQANPRFSARTTEEVTGVFQRYIDRMETVFSQAFHTRPPVSYAAVPLSEALEASMTFGYYDPPKLGDEVGRFRFNARNLRQQPLMNIASLTYHELVPGHHLHLTTQNRNGALLPVGRHSFVNAYNEAWAEYSATLAGELGMYVEPEERYGRLIMDAFLTSRLVVDTGMNALGWSLEKARDYMREFSSMSESEILTETLRYSCDLPAQALAYKLGDTEMVRLREKLKSRLGARFDLRDYHAAVLSVGALPMSDLAWHLEKTLVPTDAPAA